MAVLLLPASAGYAAPAEGVAGEPASQTDDRPFILPFAEPPGPDTWLLGQTYGNTVGPTSTATPPTV
ncbi:MAG: hypothetical protein R2844_16875 [Caldilineales bacterium]